MKKIAALALVFITSITVLGQTPAPARGDEMKKLGWMAGQWKGESWTEMRPGERKTDVSTGTVHSKLGGSVIVIEGLHKEKGPGKDGKEIAHESYAVLLYDGRAKHYRFLVYAPDFGYAEFEPKITDENLQWGFQIPQGTMRYTLSRTEKDEWHEVGEISQDGKTWRRFFEMTLRRAK